MYAENWPVYVRIGPNIHKDRLIQQQLCTCPWCHLVWPHKETPGQPSYDLQDTRKLLGGPRDVWDCPGCGKPSTTDSLREVRVKFTRERAEQVQGRSR